MKKWKLVLPVCLLAVVMVFTLVGCGDDEELITLASGSTGGVYYPLGGAMAEVVNRDIEGLQCQSESTGASVENIRLVENRESDVAMAMGDAVFNAMEGTDPFEEPKSLKALFNMYPAPLHMITFEEYDIETVEDLRGKSISIDAPGSGCEAMSLAVLEALGILDDVDTYNYTQSESVEAMSDGDIDVVFWNFATPGSVVEELAVHHDLKYISLSDDEVDTVLADHDYYFGTTVEAGTYPGQDEDIQWLGVGNDMVVHEDLDEDIAYNFTKAQFENLDRLAEAHDIANQMSPEVGIETSIEMHPGAVRYFEEIGAL